MSEPPTVPATTTQPLPREHLPPSAEEKAQWVKRFEESGLSIRKFSDEHKIPRMSLWHWIQQSRLEAAPAAESTRTEFAELKLPPTLARADWAVELTLPNGTVLRLSKDVPGNMVDQLLRLC